MKVVYTVVTRSSVFRGLESALKMQEMPFQRPKFQNIFGGACPRPP